MTKQVDDLMALIRWHRVDIAMVAIFALTVLLFYFGY
jgi:hypothetical protein